MQKFNRLFLIIIVELQVVVISSSSKSKKQQRSRRGESAHSREIGNKSSSTAVFFDFFASLLAITLEVLYSHNLYHHHLTYRTCTAIFTAWSMTLSEELVEVRAREASQEKRYSALLLTWASSNKYLLLQVRVFLHWRYSTILPL